MSEYSNLKAMINANIKANNNEEITGPIVNSVLTAMVDSLGAGYQFMGVATPATDPGTPDQKVFYLASEAGTYTNFGGIVLTDGEVAVLMYDGEWSKGTTGVATVEKIRQLGQKVDEVFGGNFTPELNIEQGNISNTGEDATSTTRIRTSGYVTADSISISSNGNKVYVRGYKDDGTYVNGIGWISTTQTISIEGATKYRFIFAYSDDSPISPEDYAGLDITIVANYERKYAKTNESSVNTITIAAFDSSDEAKRRADIVASSLGAGIAAINSAIQSIPNGGRIYLRQGTYEGTGYVDLNVGNIILEGESPNTYIHRTTSGNTIIVSSSISGVILRNLTVNATVAPHSSVTKYENVFLNGIEITNGYETVTVIAAVDSPDRIKSRASFVCDGVNDKSIIVNALNNISAVGGVVKLCAGTYTLDSALGFTKSRTTLLGDFGATRFIYTDGFSGTVALQTLNNSRECTVIGIDFGAKSINLRNSGSGYAYDCTIENKYYHEYDVSGVWNIKPAAGIAGINSAITALGTTGGTIVLEEGTYEGTAGIAFLGQNVIIEGKGVNTVIKRSSGNDVYADAGAKNNVIRNVSFYNKFQQSGDYPTQRYRIENCWNGGTIINQYDNSNVIINVGVDYFFKDVSTPYSRISSTSWVYGNRFEIHIHGHIVQTEELWCDKPVSLVGHNALFEFRGVGNVRATFSKIASAYTQGLYGWIPVVVKDIHFIKTGCFNYRNNAAVSVLGENWKFINCIFENASSSPSPFDNSIQSVGEEDANGCRRHGIGITIETYGNECKTEFHNCTAIGSPYGFQSCRGWYFMAGSPKLFNCIGYGGGIGEFGHGMISHEASDAKLFNCIGYAGEHTYRQGAGFRYQAHGKNNLVGCVGYGSRGTQLKSDGVPYSALHTRCQEVGITDESFFYDGQDVNYSGLTVKSTDDGYNNSRILLGNAIKNSDIVLTELGGVSEQGYGISLWSHNGLPTIENSNGFAGHGANSAGIRIEATSAPTIIGGYFGEEKQMFKANIVKNSGAYCLFTVPSNLLSQYTSYVIKGVGLTINGGNYLDRHFVLHLETDESTPRPIIDGYDLYHISAIGRPSINGIDIPAGVGLRAYITENGNIVSDYADNYYFFMITFVASPSGAVGCMIAQDAEPIIKDAIFTHENIGVGLYTTSQKYLLEKCVIKGKTALDTDRSSLRVFDCRMDGLVGDDISFSQKNIVNGSSNYTI